MCRAYWIAASYHLIWSGSFIRFGKTQSNHFTLFLSLSLFLSCSLPPSQIHYSHSSSGLRECGTLGTKRLHYTDRYPKPLSLSLALLIHRVKEETLWRISKGIESEREREREGVAGVGYLISEG